MGTFHTLEEANEYKAASNIEDSLCFHLKLTPTQRYASYAFNLFRFFRTHNPKQRPAILYFFTVVLVEQIQLLDFAV